jgi:hypothetical protein
MLKQTSELITTGCDAGQFTLSDWPADIRARAVFSLVWTPENIIQELGTKGALDVGRDAVLRGVKARDL